MQRPDRSEYKDYYHTYVSKVPEGNILDLMESQLEKTLDLLGGLSDSDADYRYADGKWSIKEVLAHLIDVERVFSVRALAFARRDAARLPSFDQNPYVANSEASDRTIDDLLEELAAVRRATRLLFGSFSNEATRRRGIASDNEFSVRAVAYIIVGHEIHHRGILEERYLTSASSA